MKKQFLHLGITVSLLLSLFACASNPTLDMKAAADAFLASLDAKQKAKAQAAFDSKDRTDWVFLPDKYVKPEKKRFGLTLKEMSEEQRNLGIALLHSALSEKGKLTVQNTRLLEAILFKLTKDPIRDKDLYYISVFGNPSDHHSWGWTFEGHHLSINVTVVNGKELSLTPTFYGSNPGVVKEGEHKGLQSLASVENIARKLAVSLNSAQLSKATVFAKAPKDIFSGDHTKVARKEFDIKKGLPYKEMTADQQALVKDVINAFTETYRPDLLDSLDNSPLSEIDSLVFVWVGSTRQGKPHYYRLVTTNHLLEYDNVQNGAMHPHAAWREFDGDFGEDLLLKHHQHEHNH
ncbi:MAG: DUF3500 domain-containing protein [Lentisphaeraceae bacterium]|nr:DUF3500 domain-containing protein [Lentisphaeraceae bacterium]